MKNYVDVLDTATNTSLKAYIDGQGFLPFGTKTDEYLCGYESTGTKVDCDLATSGSGSAVRSTSATITTPSLTLSTSASTTSGRIRYDATNDWIYVGDGSAADAFMPVTSYTDEYFCSYESTGTTLVCDVPISNYYLKTEIDTQGEVESIWSVSLATDTEVSTANTSMKGYVDGTFLMAESDPTIAVLTANKMCVANASGTGINCTEDIPTGGGDGGTIYWETSGIWLIPNTTATSGIDDILVDWIQASNWTNVSITESQISDFGSYALSTEPLWTANQSNYFTKAEISSFDFWNDSYASFNKTYADTLYAGIGAGGWAPSATTDLNMSEYDIFNLTDLNMSGDIQIGTSDADHSIWFYEDGSPTGERIYWANVADWFTITDSIDVEGTISSDADIKTTGSGDDLWLGDTSQSTANFKAYADGSLNISEGAFEVTATGEVQVDSGNKVCLDGATCSKYIWYNGSNVQIVG